MKIGLRGGHSPNCKGAMGILDEQIEVRKIYNELAPMLQASGHQVIDCNSNANNVGRELSEGTNKANSNACDIYMTLHMNASGGRGHGTECLLYDNTNGIMNDIAYRICKNFEDKGFQNRGIKYRKDLHDLNSSSMPATIVETLFCDNEHDVNLYRSLGARGVAELIFQGITGKEPSGSGNNKPITPTPPQPQKPTTPSKSSVVPEIVYGVKTLHHGILPDVKGHSDFAGYVNDAIVGVKIGVSFGKIEYRVHCVGKGWLPKVTGNNWNDHNNGYAGDGKTSIDAIQIYYYTDTSKTGGKMYTAVYQVKPFNSSSYYGNVYDTNWENGDGNHTAGCFGVPFTELKISLE